MSKKPRKLPDLTPRPFRVRCLGLGPEHYFMSRDKVNDRICSSCRPKFDSIRSSAAYEKCCTLIVGGHEKD